MDTFIIIALVLGYFSMCGKLIRWAAARADRAIPGWGDIIGMLFWPATMGRIVRWLIPNSWQWPEMWIGMGVWIVTLFFVLFGYFKLPPLGALIVCIVIFAIAVFTALQILPHVQAKP